MSSIKLKTLRPLFRKLKTKMTCIIQSDSLPDTDSVHSVNYDPRHIFQTGKNPQLFVFDLDYTLWPFDNGLEIIGPFKTSTNGIVDYYGNSSNPYPDVCEIMSALVDYGIPIAIASRNAGVDGVKSLLQQIKFDCKKGTISIWDALPSPGHFHAYSSGISLGKNLHFTGLIKNTGIEFSQMLFFDDNPENIVYAKRQGTISIQVRKNTGLTWNAIQQGLLLWREMYDL